MPELKVDFAPARRWEAASCIRLILETVRDRDPWANRILARPWSLFSLVRYAYLLDNFVHSDTFFVVVSGERAGIISMRRQTGFLYLDIVGLLPRFQRSSAGRHMAEFIRDYGVRNRYQWGVAAMAVTNRPAHMLSAAFGGRLLGLSTTRLTLASSPSSCSSELVVKRLEKSPAQEAWKRWRLYEVEHVAGHKVLELATHLLGALPRGEHLALYHQGKEIGFALARPGKGERKVELYPGAQFWSNAATADLVAGVARHLAWPIRTLILTQTHANALTASGAIDFERRREEDRHLVFFTPA